MRLIHTSDWHLGQSLHGYERQYEHQCFLDWLSDQLEEQAADALLIAGDVFESSNPSAEAQRQFYCFLSQLQHRLPHLQTVVIAGNHDSAGRLEAPSPLLESLRVRVVGQTRWLGEQIDLDHLLWPLCNRHGETAAWVLAVPYLRPADVPRVEQQGERYVAGVRELYRQLTAHALTRRQAGQALIAMGHCHMSGGKASADSERKLVIGGVEDLGADVFTADLAYVALGHLHLAQGVGEGSRVRYSGSPLPLSFSETAYPHQVVRVDLDGDRLAAVESLRVPRAVELLRLPKQHLPLDQALEQLAQTEWAALEPERQPFLEVQVQLNQHEPALRERIEEVLAGYPVRLVRISSQRPQGVSASTELAETLPDLQTLDPELILKMAHLQRYGTDAPPALMTVFAELLRAEAGRE